MRFRTHPDRLVNATAAEKRKATERFQVRILPLLPTHSELGSPIRHRPWPMHISSCRIRRGGRSMIYCTNPRRSVQKTLLHPPTSLRISRICSVEREPNLLLRTLNGRMLITCLRMFSMRLVDSVLETQVLLYEPPLRFCYCGLALATRGPEPGSVVGIHRSRLWCRLRVYRRERPRSHGWGVRWKPSRCS